MHAQKHINWDDDVTFVSLCICFIRRL